MSYTGKPKHGFLLGKFMPPHQGHVFMCEFARNYCETLTILLTSLPDEPIPGRLRYQWMKEMFPNCRVVWIYDILPQEPNGPDDHEFWKIWHETIIKAMKMGHGGGAPLYHAETPTPDVIFASEHYGQHLADDFGCRFVPVDIARTARTVSGTAIRNDPFKYWDYIPHVVRPYFTKRVCMFGPESTGKTTLGLQLARQFNTVFVPEYGRTYTETFGSDNLTHDDLKNIVNGHIASVAAGKRQANRFLIEDTDPIMTAVWSDMLLGERNPWFAKFADYADLYLLCDVEGIPWVDDGTRYFSNDADRKRFFDICEKELIDRGLNYVRITGSGDDRFADAVAAIEMWVKQ